MYNLKNIMQRALLYLIFQRGQLVFMWKEITYKFDVLMNTTQFTEITKKRNGNTDFYPLEVLYSYLCLMLI